MFLISFENASNRKQEVLRLSALLERTKKVKQLKVFLATANIYPTHIVEVLYLI